MKFCYIKKEQICHQCGSTLLQGDEAVIIRMKVSGGIVIPFAFHPQCFMDWNTAIYMYRLENFRIGRPPPKKKLPRGRPRKYKNTALANKLKCSIHYYKKIGNEDKVQELQAKLSKLRA